jgi:hypothetical protein
MWVERKISPELYVSCYFLVAYFSIWLDLLAAMNPTLKWRYPLIDLLSSLFFVPS